MITNQSQTYLVLNFMADAVFFFLPVLLAFSAAVKLKCSPYLAAAVALVMVHPAWTALVAAKNPVSLFDIIPLLLTSYSEHGDSDPADRARPGTAGAMAASGDSSVTGNRPGADAHPDVMGTLAMAVLGPIGGLLGG